MKKKGLSLLLAACLVAAVSCAGKENPSSDGIPSGDETPSNDGEQKENQVTPMENENEASPKPAENASPTGKAPEPAKEEGQDKAETWEKVPYRLYPTSRDAWVGDVMPMEDGDTLQLYYLYDTDHNGIGYHPIWKFSTKNLYEYQDDGLAVPYGAVGEPDLAIGTGSVLIAQDGKYHCFYTGHNDTFPEKGMDKECVMHAVSDDNVTWTKIPEDTFYAEDHYSGDDFRDPFVFWNEEEECYWLLIAAREASLGGVVAKYTSTDLSHWTICDPLYAPQQQYMLECPDLFQMGDWYYLFYSWDCVTYYAMGKSINGPFTAPEDNVLDGTGFCFYAAKTAELNGTRYLCGWVGRKPEPKDTSTHSWAGSLLLHELVQKEDGRLGVRAPHTFSEYFTKEAALEAKGTLGEVEEGNGGYQLSAGKKEAAVVDFGTRRPTFMLECTVTFAEEGGYAGFAFGPEDDYGRYTGMALDAKKHCVHYEGCVLSRIDYAEPLTTTAFHFEPGREYKVTLVMENEIAVLYIDDTKALSSRVYKSLDGAHLGIFANNSSVEFKNMRIMIPE